MLMISDSPFIAFTYYPNNSTIKQKKQELFSEITAYGKLLIFGYGYAIIFKNQERDVLMKILKKWILFLLFCLMILPYNSYATTIGPGGICGENLIWTLQMDGTLIISGTGDMTDFGPSYAENISVPWGGNRADIKTVVIEEGVTSIGNNAFVACANLKTVTMPQSISRIGEHAFENCFNLMQADIPTSVTEIGEYAFGGCKALTEVTIPKGITAIADYAFENCVSLKKIHIPGSITRIGRSAFQYCPSLTEIVLPESIAYIGHHAFDECENLGHILFIGTQEQWATVTLRTAAIADVVHITYGYIEGMQYHIFTNDCTEKCIHCAYTRDADHIWDEGVDNGEVDTGKFTVTYTCTVCGEIRVDVTYMDPAIPTQPSEPSSPSKPTTPTVKPIVHPTATAAGINPSQDAEKPDENGVLIVVFAVVTIVVACVVLIVLKRRK